MRRQLWRMHSAGSTGEQRHGALDSIRSDCSRLPRNLILSLFCSAVLPRLQGDDAPAYTAVVLCFQQWCCSPTCRVARRFDVNARLREEKAQLVDTIKRFQIHLHTKAQQAPAAKRQAAQKQVSGKSK